MVFRRKSSSRIFETNICSGKMGNIALTAANGVSPDVSQHAMIGNGVRTRG